MNIVLFREGEDFFPPEDRRFLHIRDVLKLKKGDVFKAGVINGYGGTAVIDRSDENGISFRFTPVEDMSRMHPLTLIIGIVRPICMRRIIREAVSLGVRKMVLTVTDTGEKSYLDSSLVKNGEYMRIAVDGAEQSGRTGLSEIIFSQSVSEAISETDEEVKIVMDTEMKGIGLKDFDLEGKSVAIAIGPERGWTGRERNEFIGRSFLPASLGDRILRTETAVVASASIAIGNMGG